MSNPAGNSKVLLKKIDGLSQLIDKKFSGTDKQLLRLSRQTEGLNNRLDGTDKQLLRLSRQTEGLNNRFDEMENKLTAWKSELFDKIDNFLGRIDGQDKEIAALGFRSEEHEQRLNNLGQTSI